MLAQIIVAHQNISTPLSIPIRVTRSIQVFNAGGCIPTILATVLSSVCFWSLLKLSPTVFTDEVNRRTHTTAESVAARARAHKVVSSAPSSEFETTVPARRILAILTMRLVWLFEGELRSTIAARLIHTALYHSTHDVQRHLRAFEIRGELVE